LLLTTVCLIANSLYSQSLDFSISVMPQAKTKISAKHFNHTGDPFHAFNSTDSMILRLEIDYAKPSQISNVIVTVYDKNNKLVLQNTYSKSQLKLTNRTKRTTLILELPNIAFSRKYSCNVLATTSSKKQIQQNRTIKF